MSPWQWCRCVRFAALEFARRQSSEVFGLRMMHDDRRGRKFGNDLAARRQRRADRALRIQQAPNGLVVREAGAGTRTPGVALAAVFAEAELAPDAPVRRLGQRVYGGRCEAVQKIRLAVIAPLL